MSELVSVVIPIYNSEKFLQDSIKSVLSQTYSPLEIIVVDDGSTDKSLEILNQFKDKITVIHQENQGLASALKTGVKKMTGKWFKWFSPDDILNPNAIEVLFDQAKKLGKNYIIYSNWEIIDEHNNHLRKFSETNFNDLDQFQFNVRLLDGQQINVNTSLVPSWLFENGCIFQELEDPVLVDYDFFLRAGILHEIRFHLIEKTLVQYRINNQQLSHKTISKSLSNLDLLRKSTLNQLDFTIREKFENSLQDYQKSKPLKRKSMEFSLKIMNKALPEIVTDKILLLYLNKIRRTR